MKREIWGEMARGAGKGRLRSKLEDRGGQG